MFAEKKCETNSWMMIMFIILIRVLFCTGLYLSECNELYGAFLVLQQLKIHLPMQQMHIRSLGLENALQKEMATHSSILAWEILWTEEPSPCGLRDSDRT